MVGLLCALLALSPSADWPHVRGPGYDGHSRETGLAGSWPEAGPPLLWSRDLGQGYSGVVAVGDAVFTQFQTRLGQFVLCLDARDGSERWKTRVDTPWQAAGAYPGPYATPTVAGGAVYFATPTGVVGRLDAGRGSIKWTRNVRRDFAAAGVEFGYAATPTVESGLVVLPVGGPGAALVALDATDGATRWQSGDDAASYCPALPVNVNGRRCVVGYLQNVVTLHDVRTGERLWRHEVSSAYDEHSAWPLWRDGRLMLSAPFKAGALTIALSGSPLSAKTIWRSPKLSNDVCSSLLSGGAVYGFDVMQYQSSPHRATRGAMRCLDWETGRVNWTAEGVGQCGIIAADGKLVLLDDTGHLILADGSAEAYRERGRARVLDGLCWTPPALAHGRLFVRNPARLLAFAVAEGAEDTGATAPPVRAGFDWSSVLPAEPEYPHDPPTRGMLLRWFAACALIWLVAACVSLPFGDRRGEVVLLTALVLGAAATTFIGATAGEFVMTWPVALYAAFRATVAVGLRAATKPHAPRRTWAARLMLVGFAAACYGYYRLCEATGYVMAWGFLAGFPVGLVVLWPTARLKSWWARAAVEATAFAGYFAASGVAPGVKEWLGG